MKQKTKALQGIRILDFSHVFQGPLATQLLADYGADVIKVERPDAGDWSRVWGPFVNNLSMPYANLNRNKRCLALNIKHADGKAIILKLIESCDVLVHNFRSGVMERLGLGYDDLKTINPRLIYATSSGWGDTGPYVDRKRGGHDLMARAEGGWFYQHDEDSPPAPAGISVDYAAGLMLAQGIMMALFARTHTGQGQFVSTDLLSVAFHAHAWEAAAELNAEQLNRDEGIGVTEQLINKSFKTADGWIEVSPVFSDDSLRDISLALGMDDLSKDSRFKSFENRMAHRATINDIIADCFLEKTTEEWLAHLEPQGVLCAKIRTFADAADDPQIHANNMVIEMKHPDAQTLRLLGTPLRLHGTMPEYCIPPAKIGEHNAEILKELGYSTEQIDGLKQNKVI